MWNTRQDAQDDQGTQLSHGRTDEHLIPFDGVSAKMFSARTVRAFRPMQSKRLRAMPLPNVASGTAHRCMARCKRHGGQCRNLAAFGCTTCRYHGARRSDEVKRGDRHWNYQNGRETLEAKANRSARLRELRELEALSFSFGLATGPKWRGRKPRA